MRTVRCYFSFRSPFAAIAVYRLRRAPQFADVNIDLLPVWPEIIFGGHMDNPTDNLFKMAYIFGDAARQAELAGLPREQMDAFAKRITLPDGIDYRSAKVGIPASSERWDIAHCAFLYAKRNGKAWAFADLLSLRRFGFDGGPPADIQKPESVAELAEKVGLDGELAANAWRDEDIAQEVTQVVEQSERDGVFGVPFFAIDDVNGTEKFWGNDRLEQMLWYLQRKSGEETLPTIEAASLTQLRD